MDWHYELDVCMQTHDLNMTPCYAAKWYAINVMKYAVIEMRQWCNKWNELKDVKRNNWTYQLISCLCTRPADQIKTTKSWEKWGLDLGEHNFLIWQLERTFQDVMILKLRCLKEKLNTLCQTCPSLRTWNNWPNL